MKPLFTSISVLSIVLALTLAIQINSASAQTKKVLIDVAHGQRFWDDPAEMAGKDPQLVERVKYMTGEITSSAKAGNAGIGYVKGKIDNDVLSKCDLLFIHLPSARYDASEVAAIKKYLDNGGALFLAMDVDFWATLDQTNVNDIVTPYGITFGVNSADTLTGGYSKVSKVTKKAFKIPYHGARRLEGGTTFAQNDRTSETFGTFVELKKGGKIIAMGEGMVSLYMNQWQGVTDYQCQEFMQDTFSWLLR
jgi:hypothetical protein